MQTPILVYSVPMSNRDSAFLPATGVLLVIMAGIDHMAGGVFFTLISSFLSQNGF